MTWLAPWDPGRAGFEGTRPFDIRRKTIAQAYATLTGPIAARLNGLCTILYGMVPGVKHRALRPYDRDSEGQFSDGAEVQLKVLTPYRVAMALAARLIVPRLISPVSNLTARQEFLFQLGDGDTCCPQWITDDLELVVDDHGGTGARVVGRPGRDPRVIGIAGSGEGRPARADTIGQ
jgi:hypothetical protein